MQEKRSTRWIRQQLTHALPTHAYLRPQTTVIAADVTFWGRRYGVCVFRSPTLKRNLWWQEVTEETPAVYAAGLHILQEQGWDIRGVVIDGKRGVAKVFEGIPVQSCQFHQVKAVTKYLTRKPQTRAGWELRSLTLTIAKSEKAAFARQLAEWHMRWDEFLSERTPCPCCAPKRWPYTHRRLRAAYRSLVTNLPLLFTYQDFSERTLPNTTNCLDGMFSQIKNRLAVHRGAKPKFRYKIISEILSGSN